MTGENETFLHLNSQMNCHPWLLTSDTYPGTLVRNSLANFTCTITPRARIRVIRSNTWPESSRSVWYTCIVIPQSGSSQCSFYRSISLFSGSFKFQTLQHINTHQWYSYIKHSYAIAYKNCEQPWHGVKKPCAMLWGCDNASCWQLKLNLFYSLEGQKFWQIFCEK